MNTGKTDKAAMMKMVRATPLLQSADSSAAPQHMNASSLSSESGVCCRARSRPVLLYLRAEGECFSTGARCAVHTSRPACSTINNTPYEEYFKRHWRYTE